MNNNLTEIIVFRTSKKDKKTLQARASANNTNVGSLLRKFIADKPTITDNKLDELRTFMFRGFRFLICLNNTK